MIIKIDKQGGNVMENINFVEVIKDILGEEEYLQLLKDISIENMEKGISYEKFFNEVANKYCFIILLIGFSKKIDINTYYIEKEKPIIKIQIKEFVSRYEKYIKQVENKKFELLKNMI